MKGNVIVGQSGGPTAAINSSLAGVYRTAKDRGANKVYGMLFGIQGLLQERYIDLSEYITNDLDTEPLRLSSDHAAINCLRSTRIKTYTKKSFQFSKSLTLKPLFTSAETTQWIRSKNFLITPL